MTDNMAIKKDVFFIIVFIKYGLIETRCAVND